MSFKYTRNRDPKISTVISKNFYFEFSLNPKEKTEQPYIFSMNNNKTFVVCKGKNEREVLQDDKTHGSLVNYIKKLREEWFTDEKREEIIKKWKKNY